MSFRKFKYIENMQEPKMSILRSGFLLFNKAAILKYEIKKYKYCYLYYDEKEKVIGVELLDIKKDNINLRDAIKIYDWRDGFQTTINAMRFLAYYKIEHKNISRKYIIKYDDKKRLMCIQVDRPIQVKDNKSRRFVRYGKGNEKTE